MEWKHDNNVNAHTCVRDKLVHASTGIGRLVGENS